MAFGRTHTSWRARFVALGVLLTLLATTSFSMTSTVAVAKETASDSRPEIVVAPASAVSSPNAETLLFEVFISNPTAETIDAGSVTLWLSSTPITSRDQLNSSPDTLASEFLGTVKTPKLAKGDQRRIALEVNQGDETLGLDRSSGVYLLAAKYLVKDEQALITSTPIIWGGVTAPPIKLTYVVPFVLPTAIDTVPTAAELEEVSPRLLQLLNLAETRRATLAIDPRIITAVRTLGNRAPESATELLSRFERTSNPLFLLQFADADPAAQSALGFDELIQPTGFDYLNGDEVNTTALSETQQAQQVAELTSLPNAQRVAWPANGEMNSQTQSWLQAQGITSFILESNNVTASTPAVQIGDARALVSDSTLSRLAAEALSSTAIVKRHAAQSEIAALTALLASQQQSVVLALDRGAVANSNTPESILRTFDSFAWVQAAPETEQAVSAAALLEGSVSPQRIETLQMVTERSTQIDELAPLLVHPEYLPQYQRVRFMHALSATLDSTAINGAAAFADIAETDEKLLRGVRPVSTESVQLVGSSSEVPVTVRNWLPFETNASVQVTPVSAVILVTDRRYTVKIAETSTEKLLVPVKSRVSRGQTAISVEVRNIEGTQVFATETIPITLRTAVETVLISTFGAAVAVLLLFGIWRSVRRTRSPSHINAQRTSIDEAPPKR